MADPTFDRLYGDATQFSHPTVGVTALNGAFGHAGALDGAALATQVCNLATTSPIALAAVMANDNERVTILHRPVQHVAVPGSPTPADNAFFALYGNTRRGTVLVRFPENAFRAATAMNVGDDVGAIGTALTALGAGSRAGPHAHGDANTEEITVRRVVVLPTEWSVEAVRRSTLTFAEFYTTFIQPIAPGDLGDYEYVTNWWRCACTRSAAGGDARTVQTRVALATPGATAAESARLATWKDQMVSAALRPLVPAAPPALTDAAMQNAIGGLATTLQNNHAEDLR